jgi:Domain of unknown function (DUF1707)
MLTSDLDRERVTRVLGVHYTQGRLTPEELEERTERVYRSRTRGQLAKCIWDLPPSGIWTLVARRIARIERVLLRMHAATYVTMNATLVGIWALAGEGAFWPAWLLVPTTALLGWHALASRLLARALGRDQPRKRLARM